MYRNGLGVEQDFKEAFKWFQKAADQGDVNAQYFLGFAYFKGEGVLEDYVTGYAWWNIAAANEIGSAKISKGEIAKTMTAEDISKAQELSKEMIKKNPKLLKKK